VSAFKILSKYKQCAWHALNIVNVLQALYDSLSVCVIYRYSWSEAPERL